MWLGTALGRFWAWAFGGERVGHACDDPSTQVWLVRRMLPRWAIGQAWGRVILVRRDYWDHPRVARLLAHEYCHVRQWRRYGSAFILAYLAASVWALARYGPRSAYRMNRFEQEARREEHKPT
jgi:hypothetical protein